MQTVETLGAGQNSRIFLDCSQTYHSTSHNGIQRVVRNLARQSRTANAEHGVPCQPVIRRGNSYFRVSSQLHVMPCSEETWSKIKRAYYAVMTPLLAAIPIKVLRRWLLPRPGRRGLFNLPYQLLLLARALWGWVLAGLRLAPSPLVKFREGDTLVIMEPCTFRSDDMHVLDGLRSQGVRIGLLVFDIIPLTHPQLCADSFVAAFGSWLRETSQRVDFFVSISNAVSEALKDYLRSSVVARQWTANSFSSFPLGAELEASSAHGSVRSAVQAVFANDSARRSHLLVATLEPRKNHAFLLDAFELAWKDGSPANLVLVGRVGWKCDQLIHRIQSHPEFGNRLHWFNDLTDAELRHCYSHGSALIYPSIAEGFGLPIIEALSHRMLVLASDIPVHREVGREYCDYFDLTSPATLVHKIRLLDHNAKAIAVADPANYSIADWRQSFREFLAQLVVQTRQTDRSSHIRMPSQADQRHAA